MYYPDEVEQGDMLDKRIEKLMRIKEGNKNMRGEDVYNYVVENSSLQVKCQMM